MATPSKIPSTAALAFPTNSPIPQVENELTCECCYGDYPFEDMVSCSEGNHLFCGNCVKDYAKEQLYGNDRSEFKCMSSDGCIGWYTDGMMKKALSPRTMANVEKHAFRREVMMNGSDNLW